MYQVLSLSGANFHLYSSLVDYNVFRIVDFNYVMLVSSVISLLLPVNKDFLFSLTFFIKFYFQY